VKSSLIFTLSFTNRTHSYRRYRETLVLLPPILLITAARTSHPSAHASSLICFHFLAYALHRTKLHPSVTFAALAYHNPSKFGFPALGTLSSMDIFRIINEPIAAPIAYGLDKSQVSSRILAVILCTDKPVKLVRSATAFRLRLDSVTISLSRMGGDLTTAGIPYIARPSLFATTLPTRNSPSGTASQTCCLYSNASIVE